MTFKIHREVVVHFEMAICIRDRHSGKIRSPKCDGMARRAPGGLLIEREMSSVQPEVVIGTIRLNCREPFGTFSSLRFQTIWSDRLPDQ
jgi:hypothetical protein